jgi:hypothetical protein
MYLKIFNEVFPRDVVNQPSFSLFFFIMFILSKLLKLYYHFFLFYQ